MFSKLNTEEIHFFARLYIPITMLISLFQLPYFVSLESIGQFNELISWGGTFFKNDYIVFYFLFCITGFLYFLKPKVLLPLSLILCFFVQGEFYNKLLWHDQQITFYFLICLALFYFRPNWFQTIPIREIVFLLFSLQFFGASICKLYDGGIRWLDGHTLQYNLLEYHVLFESFLGLSIAKNIILCQFFSVAAVAFQFTMPLAVFIPRLQKLYFFLILSFITLVYLMMKIELTSMLAILLIFLPWKRIRELWVVKFHN